MLWSKWTLAILGLFAIDRLLLAAEDRGWIYYRKRKPHLVSQCMSAALFQMQAILQPDTQHIVEQQREIREDEDEDGRKVPSPDSAIAPRNRRAPIR
jgi:hypothetical protein